MVVVCVCGGDGGGGVGLNYKVPKIAFQSTILKCALQINLQYRDYNQSVKICGIFKAIQCET